jgi:hypothetical protein
MLVFDSRWAYALLDPGDYAMQSQIQCLSILAYAADGDYMVGLRLKTDVGDISKDARLLSGIHSSSSDQEPHLTLLLPAMFADLTDRIYHIVARFNAQRKRWEYVKVKQAQNTTRDRVLRSPSSYTWTQLQAYKNLS